MEDRILSTPRGCFGFQVRSELPFEFLRRGGREVLTVAERDTGGAPSGDPIREWLPRADHPFHARLHQAGDDYRFWVEGLGTYDIHPQERPRIDVPAGADPLAREERLWGIPAVLCFLARGDHSLHAGAVDLGGRAVAFGAPGRFGKTTLASAFVGASHRLLSEDSTCLRIGSPTAVLPGPAMLRIRRGTRAGAAIEGTTELARDEERVHLSLNEDRRGTADPVPLAGVIFLRTWEEDGCRLEAVAPDEAIPDLWTLSFHIPTDEGRADCFDRIGRLVTAVPVWNLYRPFRFDRLPDVIDAIVEAFSSP